MFKDPNDYLTCRGYLTCATSWFVKNMGSVCCSVKDARGGACSPRTQYALSAAGTCTPDMCCDGFQTCVGGIGHSGINSLSCRGANVCTVGIFSIDKHLYCNNASLVSESTPQRLLVGDFSMISMFQSSFFFVFTWSHRGPIMVPSCSPLISPRYASSDGIGLPPGFCGQKRTQGANLPTVRWNASLCKQCYRCASYLKSLSFLSRSDSLRVFDFDNGGGWYHSRNIVFEMRWFPGLSEHGHHIGKQPTRLLLPAVRWRRLSRSLQPATEFQSTCPSIILHHRWHHTD